MSTATPTPPACDLPVTTRQRRRRLGVMVRPRQAQRGVTGDHIGRPARSRRSRHRRAPRAARSGRRAARRSRDQRGVAAPLRARNQLDTEQYNALTLRSPVDRSAWMRGWGGLGGCHGSRGCLDHRRRAVPRPAMSAYSNDVTSGSAPMPPRAAAGAGVATSSTGRRSLVVALVEGQVPPTRPARPRRARFTSRRRGRAGASARRVSIASPAAGHDKAATAHSAPPRSGQ